MKNVKRNLKLIPEIWKNKASILEGIKNRTFKQEDIEKLAEYRQSKCESCIWNSKHYKKYEDVPEVIKEVKDREWIESCIGPDSERCLQCSCNISLDSSFKLRSLSSSCPLPEPLWEAVVEDDLQAELYKVIMDNEEDEK